MLSAIQAILDSIADLPEDATVLLFATSVAHAELLAGLLSLEAFLRRRCRAGPLVVRAAIHRAVHAGEIRVLTNCGA